MYVLIHFLIKLLHKMADKLHIRHCLLYLFDSMQVGVVQGGSNKAQTATDLLNGTYGPGTVSKATCEKWFARYRAGDRSVEDKQRAGRPSTFDENKLLQLLDEDDSLTTTEIASLMGCGVETVRRHLHETGKKYRLGHWVPHALDDSLRQRRVEICTELLRMYESGRLKLDCIVTGDETYISYDNTFRGHHWLSTGQTATPTPKHLFYGKKQQLCVWWTARGIVHWELMPRGQHTNAALYCAQLERMTNQLRYGPNKEHLAARKQWLLLHDNATAHTARQTVAKIEELKLWRIPHCANSPDKAPSDFHLFRSLKNYLRGKVFTCEQQLRSAIDTFFSSKGDNFYREGFAQLPERWREIVESGGEYVLEA